jgi:hypothetical protein
LLAPERFDEVGVTDVALDEPGVRRDVLAVAAREVIDGDHLESTLQAGVDDVRTHESGGTGDERAIGHGGKLAESPIARRIL